MMDFAILEMLTQSEIYHLQLRIGTCRREKKVFQLEISMNNAYRGNEDWQWE
jgi:hypothetical protein